jgi:type VI secretion system protein ImpD
MDGEPVADRATAVVLTQDDVTSKSGPAPPSGSGFGGLLDAVLRGTPVSDRRDSTGAARMRFEAFRREPELAKALALWLELDVGAAVPARSEILRRLSRDIARIDALINGQLEAILHHPVFQKLEASWRGLRYLVGKLPRDQTVKVRVLNLSWSELVDDLTGTLEFDQSQLFRKVYEDEFGMPGGEPFGVLLGDYEVHNRPAPEHPFDDIDALGRIAEVAAAAFAPFIAGVHPSFFGLDSFTDMERPIDLDRVFLPPEYLKWLALRKKADARFLGLTLPRVLMRLPYVSREPRAGGLAFAENPRGSGLTGYLWGSAVYAFGGVLIRSFVNTNWLADIRGVRRERTNQSVVVCDDGGLVTGLPAQPLSTDRDGVAAKCSTDVIVSDSKEKELDEFGFIPLCHCHDTDYSAFYGNHSVQKPEKYDTSTATANAHLSALLQYILCVSRFSHYIKVMARDMVGSAIPPEECERRLQGWLSRYVNANDKGGPELKARLPLREGRVEVTEQEGKYLCVMHLRPHFQLDQMFTAVKLTTTLSASRRA